MFQWLVHSNTNSNKTNKFLVKQKLEQFQYKFFFTNSKSGVSLFELEFTLSCDLTYLTHTVIKERVFLHKVQLIPYSNQWVYVFYLNRSLQLLRYILELHYRKEKEKLLSTCCTVLLVQGCFRFPSITLLNSETP